MAHTNTVLYHGCANDYFHLYIKNVHQCHTPTPCTPEPDAHFTVWPGKLINGEASVHVALTFIFTVPLTTGRQERLTDAQCML